MRCVCSHCRFYIGCDVCQDWFHGTCVGITQAEADFIENYVCPRCSSVNAGERIENKALSQKDVEGLKRLLRSLQVCIALLMRLDFILRQGFLPYTIRALGCPC